MKRKRGPILLLALLLLILVLNMGLSKKSAELRADIEHLQHEITDRQELINLNRMLLDEIIKLRQENNELRQQVNLLLDAWEIEPFEATAYTLECGNGDGLTATMTTPDKERTIAVDPKVIPLGSQVYVQGLGWRVAEDTGGAIRGNIIDIYMGDGPDARQEALSWGRRQVLVSRKGGV